MAHSSHRSEGFRFTSGPLQLQGIVDHPAESNGTALLLIHGWGTCRTGPQRYFVRFAEELSGRGYTVHRFDLPGRGESDGDDTQVTLDDMGRAVIDCMQFVRESQPDVERIGLCGICSGGNTAILAAVKDKADFLVLWSTFTFRAKKSTAVKAKRTGHFLGVYLRKLFSLNTWKRLFAGALNFRLIWRTLFGHYREPERNLKDSAEDVMELFRNYEGDVLFVYGAKDPEAGDARAVYRAFCEEHDLKATFVDIPDASHNFYRAEWGRELFDSSIAFIDRVAGTSHG